MKEYLKKLPQEIKDLITLAGGIADKNNMKAYLVGGFVRDLILGVNNLDLDIVVEGDGIKFAEAFSHNLGVGLIRHRRFGTATVMIKKHLKLDIATARSEYYPQPARLPEVTCGALKDDLLRRDFTINAMAISINRGDFGSFIDCFGGRKDLAAGKVRILHSLSFIDDPTRILRAIRFEQRYNFRIEPRTLELLRQAGKLRMLEKVSRERLRDELILILKEKHPRKQLGRIKELTGLDFISRGLSLPKKTRVFMQSIERQINWFKERYPKRRQLDAWLIYFIGLLNAISAKETRSICRRFAFRKGEEKRVLDYKKITPRFIRELSRNELRPSRVFALLEPLSYEVIILIKSGYKDAALSRHVEDFFEIYNGMRIHISGEDLRRNGLTPGPFYQKIFHRILNARLDGKVKAKADELELLRKIIARLK